LKQRWEIVFITTNLPDGWLYTEAVMKQVGVVSLIAGLVSLCGFLLLAQQKRADNPDPSRALWLGLKKDLSGPDGESYFRNNVKDCALPMLVGTLISATPPDHPSALVLGMTDNSTPEITLRLKDEEGKDAHLSGTAMPGSQVRFEGVAVDFTKEPFMLTVLVSTNLMKAWNAWTTKKPQ
jgi:hypothetical protein